MRHGNGVHMGGLPRKSTALDVEWDSVMDRSWFYFLPSDVSIQVVVPTQVMVFMLCSEPRPGQKIDFFLILSVIGFGFN